jgi:hypothetical protein
MHINDRADMSVFNGTEYEGLTFMQVRRMLTPSQVQRFKALNKRENRKVTFKAKNIAFAPTYATLI